MRIKSLASLLRDCDWSDANLRRIAITNVSNNERQLIRWWCKKYNTPLKPLMEHTLEEIAIEMLEDYYDEHPDLAKRFMEDIEVENWDGVMSPEYEAQVQKRLKKINERLCVDLKKYQNLEENLSEEEEQMILASLGRNLPKSRTQPNSKSELEFDEDFLGGSS